MAQRNSNGEGSIYHRKDGRFESAVILPTTAGTRKRLRFYGKTRAEVHCKLIEAKRLAHQGIPAAERNWRLDEYLDQWLREVVRKKDRPKTYDLYETTARLYLKPGLGSRSLKSLNVAIVQDFLDQRLKDGHSIRRVQVMRTVLSAALTRAMREELLQRNVARLVEVPTYKRAPVHPWSAEEAKHFLLSASDHPLVAAFGLLLLYGIRRGEVLGLRWCDIDFVENKLYIRHQLQRVQGGGLVLSPLKTDAGERDLPLLNMVSAVLTSHRATQDHARTVAGDGWMGTSDATEYVFTTPLGTPVDPDNFSNRTFHQLREQCQLRRVKLHHLRHTAATLLKNLGVPDRDIQLILGHAQISTTQMIYQHADMKTRRDALEKVESVYLRTIGGRWQQQRALPSKLPSTPNSLHKFTTFLSGGPGGTRTLDILLKRPFGEPENWSVTELMLVLKVRTKQWFVGRVAVKHCRQIQAFVRVRGPRSVWSLLNAWQQELPVRPSRSSIQGPSTMDNPEAAPLGNGVVSQ